MPPVFAGRMCFWLACAAFFGALSQSALAQDSPVHGLWVWKTASVLEMPGRAEALRDFCRSHDINEVYVSFSGAAAPSAGSRVAKLVALLHGSGLRAEALLSRADAAEPGKHRDRLLEDVRAVLQFNRNQAKSRFDGIHLDLEPQQLPENKGAGNLQFLPVLVESYRAVRALAQPAGLTVNADIPSKFLKGDLAGRQMLFTALPRLTLMLYELSHANAGETAAEQAEKLRGASQRYLEMAYRGINGRTPAKLSIALRSPDYGKLLPAMLQSLDQALRTNPHYLGWAWHSYNDELKQ
ncbi:MAG TPA: hypothetical protein VME43_04080 [Bryobacteraceae bacterium]|nr:hypothetical protein [Bryobacteraceae bacterium]